ncbi:MAG: urease accessory UreF family protein [Burkholderiales bacterium]
MAAREPTFPLVFALTVAPTDASAHDGLIAFASGWTENLVQAAIKAVPLVQLAGQRMLALTLPRTLDRVDKMVAFIERQGMLRAS